MSFLRSTRGLPSWLTRSPLATVALAIVALLVTSATFATPPLWDAATRTPLGFARLERPLAYLLGAPLFGVWDSLSLLTLSQHYALVLTLAALYVGHRIRSPRGARALPIRVTLEIGRALAWLILLFTFYAAGLLLPRPMVALALDRVELVSVDFHSHTAYSHDGWGMFSAARNRAWHEGAGYDVAYVTDHYTWRGFDDARSANPERAGERTVLLSGAEVRIHLRPTNILGDRGRYLFALDADSIYMEPDSLRAAALRGGPPPTLLYTMPGRLEYVVPLTTDEPSGVVAIELNDGSPRGLEQVRSQRAEILILADSANLAVVAASNLHGWGRTAAAWSVIELPEWRERTPDELGDLIEARLHERRRDAVTVVERRMPYHEGSTLRIVLTLPWLTWEHFRMLNGAERLSWLLWVGAVVVLRNRRRRDA